MTKTLIRVNCARCAGSGTVVRRTARHNAVCFCCGGAGHYFRKPPTKRLRVSAEDQLAADNARLRELFPNAYDADGRIIR